MFKKILKDRKGESLVETLAAVLIFTMASVGLYSMIISAARSNGRIKERDLEIQDQLAIVEEAENINARSGEATVTITAKSSQSFSIPVDIYGDAAGEQLYSYFKH